MTTQFAVTDQFGRNSLKELKVHETELPNIEARIALDLIEKWGMVTGRLDGEDSAGRAILKECSPDEVVERACSIAEKAMNTFRARGWIITGPDISELMRKTDD